MAREIRVSPDGEVVAVRSDAAEDSATAWGYFHAVHGGGWASSTEVADWEVVGG